MHKQLEDYLNEVARSLGSLPPARREEEIREMRQHLSNAIVIGKEQGQSEDEAVLAAVKRFGIPQAVSKQIVSAWRRGVWRDRRDLWWSITCVFVLSFTLSVAACFVYPAFINHFGLAHLEPTDLAHYLPWLGLVGIPWLIAISAMQGIAIGAVFPRNAVKAIPVGMTISVALYQGWCYHSASLYPYMRVETIVYIMPFVNLIPQVIIAALFARVSSRWRKARGERRAQATIGG